MQSDGGVPPPNSGVRSAFQTIVSVAVRHGFFAKLEVNRGHKKSTRRCFFYHQAGCTSCNLLFINIGAVT